MLLTKQEDITDSNGLTNHGQAFQTYLDARHKADWEFEKLLKSFKAKEAVNPTYRFDEHLKNFGNDYIEAWRARDEAASKLVPTDFLLSMKLFDHAQARAESIKGWASIFLYPRVFSI